MRCHKYRYSFSKWMKLKKWDPYAGFKRCYRYSNKLLSSGYYQNQAWGALHKAWIGYMIAINKGEWDREEYYAKVIQKLQRQLGLEVSKFDCLN